MRIRAERYLRGADVCLNPGEAANVDDEIGAALVNAGAAVEVRSSEKAVESEPVVEQATADREPEDLPDLSEMSWQAAVKAVSQMDSARDLVRVRHGENRTSVLSAIAERLEELGAGDDG